MQNNIDRIGIFPEFGPSVNICSIPPIPMILPSPPLFQLSALCNSSCQSLDYQIQNSIRELDNQMCNGIMNRMGYMPPIHPMTCKIESRTYVQKANSLEKENLSVSSFIDSLRQHSLEMASEYAPDQKDHPVIQYQNLLIDIIEDLMRREVNGS